MLQHSKLTDTLIKKQLNNNKITVLRDIQNTGIQLRFNAKRTGGHWRLLYKNKWLKVGVWPELKTADVRTKYSEFMQMLRQGKQVQASSSMFSHVEPLLVWFLARSQDNSHLSAQRKKDIKSGITKHLLPRLERLTVAELNHDMLDKRLIWPLQKTLAKSTVTKVFHTLKAAFKLAFQLRKIQTNPLASIKISDFGDFTPDKKPSNLFPADVPALLDCFMEQRLMLRLLLTLMLSLGTRISETRKANWRQFSFGDKPVWVIPASNTKTRKQHIIYLPVVLVELLQAYKQHLAANHYIGGYLFPGLSLKGCISYNQLRNQINEIRQSDWTSHDLRKCARICWQEQGVDFMVAEKMLNHEVGKVAEAYISSAPELRLNAINEHCNWLIKQNKFVFTLNPVSTQNKNNNHDKPINNGAWL